MKHRSIFVRSIALATLVPFILTSCGSKGGSGAGPGSNDAPPKGGPIVVVPLSEAPPGLDMRVSSGKQGPPAFDRAKLAPAKKIADAEASSLLARAKPITAAVADQQAFALRAKSQPPPKTGQTITGTFPPPASSLLPPAANDAGKALTVLRWMPEGAVPLAPELSVTFSQPMVAVTSQGDASATTPVKLAPQPKGNWRWIGTRTILFDPEIRFPQATTYKVEIPAGTKSANGGALAKATTFSFETPPPTVVSQYPSSGPFKLDVPMFLLFDQKIDAAKVLAKLQVSAGSQKYELKQLTDAEIEKDSIIRSFVDAAKKDEQDGRWIAFRAATKFPTDTSVILEVPAGTPSAEGPNLTKAAQTYSFQTFPPLKIVEATCGWGSDNCRPGMPFVIRFNNPLDTDRFDEAQLAITPAIPGAHIIASGNQLMVQGMTTARTSYKLDVSKNLTDEFGQTLGKAEARTFKVGDADPSFFGPDGLVVLDPAAKGQSLDFFSINYERLKVRLYQVTPADYDAYGTYLRNRWNQDKPPRMPGKLVFDETIKTTKGNNDLVETHVDLSPALKNGLGHVIALVEPYPWNKQRDGEPPTLISWVQATKLGIDAAVDGDELHAFATDLATGKPLDGIGLEIQPFGLKATSNDGGQATIALSPGGVKGSHLLVASKGDDVAFVADNSGYYSEKGSWVKQSAGKQLGWYVIDDRKMYKPGEEVTLKGWLRLIDHGKGGDIGGINGSVTQVTYKVTDSQGNQIGTGSAAVSAVGGFDTKFTLPKTPNLGHANVTFETVGSMRTSHGHGFQIEEFRRPEFEVTAQATQGPFLVGASGDVTVSAKYYSGGPLAGAPATWFVTASQTTYTPPNRDDFIFGVWEPWWGYRDAYGDDSGGRHGGDYKAPKTWSLEGKTDATGAHTLHLDFLSANPAVPMSVQTNASVTDVNRQTWTASSALIVHPASAYVGLKTKKPFVEKGTPFDLEVIGVDLDGKVLPDAKIEVKAVRLDWEYKQGRYRQTEVDPQTCDPKACTFQTKEGGSYKVSALITDKDGRPNTTTLTFWVTGGDQPPQREVKQELVQLIPDKKDYSAGNTAELLVQAPFYPAEGIVSWRRSGIVKSERLTMTGPTTVLKVPITDAMTPNLFVQVDLVGAAARTNDKGDPDPTLPKRPAYAVGQINLPIPPRQRTLNVVAIPAAAKLGPGETTKIAVEVRDAAGKPVADAETAVIVVDEAILALTGYQFPNPIDTFYPARGPNGRDHYSRAYVKLAKPDSTKLAQAQQESDGRMAMADSAAAPPAAVAAAPMEEPSAKEAEKKRPERAQAGKNGAKGGEDQNGASIAVRSNFNPLAAFSPAVRTGADGKASVEIKMPDNLTRYRIVAVAAAGEKQFGKGESAVTARLPLMVRPSPPRFLNFGDTFELPVVVQNQTDAPMTVKLAVRTTNAMITDGAGREVSVPANDRVEVRFPAAAEMAGTARFQIVGSAGKASDAAELALPVWTPATTEGFATYGVIDDGAVKQPIALPGKVVTQFGGLEVTTASTNLQALTDALLYLVHYPFDCAEQRASRVIAIAALKDVLAAFKTKDMPSAAAMQESVRADLERLTQMQNYDGGFAFWKRGDPSNPYLTVYVASALGHARAKGFAVPANSVEQAKQYLRVIESHYPAFYSEQIRRTISSFALYTRKQLGDLDIAKGQKLIAEAGGVEKLSMEANAWLLGTFAGQAAAKPQRDAITRHALNKVSETAGAANLSTPAPYGDGAYLVLSSDRRVDAVMLESLILDQPQLDLIPKIVTGLLGHRKAGRWLNTQENTFALLALDKYFQTYEKVTPDFVARVWLGDDYAGDLSFKGRTTNQFQINIPMKDVATHDGQPLTIQKDGAGRLYYRVGMTYAPASLKLEPADYGFVVQRSYEGADDPNDVTRDAQGVWHMKAGARVRVKLKMVNENRRYHVALVDPLPAGLEAMNPALAITGPIPQDPSEQKSRGAYWWWYGPWYEHQNLRDERTEAFTTLLWEGVHSYDYVARATTPGNFVVPPTKAEEMYMPETFGRSASDRVIVE
ncbi:MAG: Ig-like domain-containing protein [Deltaproteobacteria bacterium]|nr:Ig-like domain-containing protein [Deltaproteobacteria bacterium]